jgi:signal transduction histidine kinase
MEAAPQVLPGEAKQMAFVDRSIASAILDVATDAWVAIDRDWHITYRNAAKFSPARAKIRVRLDADGPAVCLAVRDEGIGLPPGSAEAIFAPFGRAENAGVQQIRGLGLGLHRCRELVARNGGQIRAESAGEGTGTEVQCWFPRDAG